MSNNLVRIVNLISIRPNKSDIPAKTFGTGVDSIDVNFTDNMDDENFDGVIYAGGKFIELSDIYDALHLNRPSYTLNTSREELQNLCKFSDLKLLEGLVIILKKYDIINKRVIFAHPGYIKSVVDQDLHILSIDVSSKLDLLALNFCEQYSPVCRAQFCDVRCKLDINDFIYKSFISDVVDQNTVLISSSVVGYHRLNIFGFGSLEITSIEGNRIVVNNHHGYKLERGVQIVLVKDCDKRIETCANKYKNAVNFRGEPNINDTISFSL